MIQTITHPLAFKVV